MAVMVGVVGRGGVWWCVGVCCLIVMLLMSLLCGCNVFSHHKPMDTATAMLVIMHLLFTVSV